jgi:hypothetical protein
MPGSNAPEKSVRTFNAPAVMTLCPSTLGANFVKPLAKRLVKIVSAKEVIRAPPVLSSQEERKHAKHSNKETNDRGRLP